MPKHSSNGYETIGWDFPVKIGSWPASLKIIFYGSAGTSTTWPNILLPSDQMYPNIVQATPSIACILSLDHLRIHSRWDLESVIEFESEQFLQWNMVSSLANPLGLRCEPLPRSFTVLILMISTHSHDLINGNLVGASFHRQWRNPICPLLMIDI